MAAPALLTATTGGALCPFPGRIAAGGTPKRRLSYCFTREGLARYTVFDFVALGRCMLDCSPGCLWLLCALCGYFCGLRVGEMGVEIGGRWATKRWSREVLCTYTVPFGGFKHLLADGDLRLVFSGSTGSLAYGACLCTRLCSGFCLGTLQSSMSGNTSSCAARPRRR